jgi:hypothetical protein
MFYHTCGIRDVKKIPLLVVTPVKTGVQAVLDALKILDSGFRPEPSLVQGFRRNDGKKIEPAF